MRISDWSSDVCSSDLIIFLQLQGQGTDFEIPGASRLHRGDFRGTPGQEELFEAFQFVRPDHAFFDFYTALAGQFDNGLACDAIEEAVWRRRVDFAVADEERSEEHTSELQSLMRISYAVFCLKKQKKKNNNDY